MTQLYLSIFYAGRLRFVVNDDEFIDNVATWTMSAAQLVAEKAGLSLAHWSPTNFALEYSPVGCRQGAPLINVGRPCYIAEIHFCAGPKTLLYDNRVQRIPTVVEAAKWVGFPAPIVAGKARPHELHLWRPDAHAFLSRVAALCQPREKIEAALRPWARGKGEWAHLTVLTLEI